MCEYKFKHGEKCTEESYKDSQYCILHVDLPENEGSKKFIEIRDEKHEKIKEKTNKNDFDFSGAKLLSVNVDDIFKNGTTGNINFTDAVIKRHVSFSKAEIKGHVCFEGAEIKRGVFFSGVKIKEGNALFNKSQIKGTVNFLDSHIDGYLDFTNSNIGKDIVLDGATIERDLLFDRAEIQGNIIFEILNIKGRLSLKKTKFKNRRGQEVINRKAKKISEEKGDRTDADYYFYREMEAKRKQKNWFLRNLEWSVQYCFGYGVKPLRVVGAWLGIVVLFAIIFKYGRGVIKADSIWDYIYFSIITAATPGYGGYQLREGFQEIASIEAILGTFMWASFIATFARKYMR